MADDCAARGGGARGLGEKGGGFSFDSEESEGAAGNKGDNKSEEVDEMYEGLVRVAQFAGIVRLGGFGEEGEVGESLWERREIQDLVTLDPEDRMGRQRRQDEVERFDLGQLATSQR